MGHHVHHSPYLLLHDGESLHGTEHLGVFLNSLTESGFEKNGMNSVQVSLEVVLLIATAREVTVKLKVLLSKPW